MKKIGRRQFFEYCGKAGFVAGAGVALSPLLKLVPDAAAEAVPLEKYHPTKSFFETREIISRRAIGAGAFPLDQKQKLRQGISSPENPAGRFLVCEKVNGQIYLRPYLPAGSENDLLIRQCFHARNTFSPTQFGISSKNLKPGHLYFVDKVDGKFVAQAVGFQPKVLGATDEITTITSAGILSGINDLSLSCEHHPRFREVLERAPEVVAKLIVEKKFDKLAKMIGVTNLKIFFASIGSIFRFEIPPDCSELLGESRASIGYLGSDNSTYFPSGVPPTIFNIAEQFYEVVRRLPLTDRVKFLGHSMGAGNVIYSANEVLGDNFARLETLLEAQKDLGKLDEIPKELRTKLFLIPGVKKIFDGAKKSKKNTLREIPKKICETFSEQIEILEQSGDETNLLEKLSEKITAEIQENANKKVELVLLNPACMPMDRLIFPFNLLTKGEFSQIVASCAPAIKKSLVHFALEKVYADEKKITPETIDHFYNLIF